MGALPPLSDADWQAEFAKYQQSPQYQLMNSHMDVTAFKSIFWWEWGHRLLARVIGAAFIIPGLWFLWAGKLKGAVGRQVLIATALLALEPIVGWWMVYSGLKDRVEVAQERLAIHLMIAAAVYGTLIYAAVGLSAKPRGLTPPGFRVAAALFAALVFAQLGLGALVAGLRAGLVYNTWPLMDGRWIPSGVFGLSPWARSILDDVTTAQFDHRMIAYAVVLFALIVAWAARHAAPGERVAKRATALAGIALAQAALGVFTLIWVVPLGLALLHQAFALVLFGMAMAHVGATRSR
jgi:cytochrome c oxidase assembly protein subunit 15